MSDAPHLDTRAANRTRKRGRPLGSRDSYQRPPRSSDPDAHVRAGKLEAELGKAYAKIGDYEQFLALKPFPGDSLALLQATQRGTYHPTLLQFRAAQVIWEEDMDRRRVELDQRSADLEQERGVYRDGAVTLDLLIRQHDEFTADRTAELDALVRTGNVTPNGAKTIRSWFIKDETEPLPLPAPSEEPLVAASHPEPPMPPPPMHDEVIQTELPDEPVTEPAEISRVIWADRPFRIFQVSSGKRFEANSAAEVEIDAADPDDVRDLLRVGCRQTSLPK